MKSFLLRLVISFGMALMAFMLLTLFTALLSSSQAPPSVKRLLPSVEDAQARILMREISPEIQAELPLFLNQRLISASGHIQCTAGETVRVKVEITQSSTGARAVGHGKDTCTGEVQMWNALAVARGRSAFQPGPAQACALAVTRHRNTITDTFAWCKTVTLVEE